MYGTSIPFLINDKIVFKDILFGTIIIDAYSEDEVEIISKSLDEICSPSDAYGWSSAGIYCFWDYDTKEIYYIGLASDLNLRFKQHNGILPVKDECSKKEAISNYFKTHNKLGYSILAQSTLSQPITCRNSTEYAEHLSNRCSIENFSGNEGKCFIKKAEGILLEAYKRNKGKHPEWNKVGGSKYGQKNTENNHYEVVKSFTDFDNNFLVSKSSLRELVINPTYERFENYLHEVRVLVHVLGWSLAQSMDYILKNSVENTYKDIVESDYFNKLLIV